MPVLRNANFMPSIRLPVGRAAAGPATRGADPAVPQIRCPPWSAGLGHASRHHAARARDDEECRLPVGLAAPLILLVSIGLWAVAIATGLWLIRIT